jgi:NAD(P)-dependent dehydrogenase (short-subunit alcohol dehydrogenase family)
VRKIKPLAFQSYFSLSGQGAVVAGGVEGIGKAIAAGLLEAGANVVIADMAETSKMPIRGLRKKFGNNRVWGCQTDVTERDQVVNLAEFSVQRLGQINILVNSAGILVRKDAFDFTDEDWQRVLDVNLKGVFICSQVIGRHMVEKRHGKIINMASLAGLLASKRNVPYCASKAGVIQITRCLALEWAKHGIQVNAIAPYHIESGISKESLSDEQKQRILSKIPLKRLGKPSDVVGCCIFLASSASDWMTGQTLIVDGGVMSKGD